VSSFAGETCHCDGPPHSYTPSWCLKGRRANGSPIDPFYGTTAPSGIVSSPSPIMTARYMPPPSVGKKVRLTTKNITDIAACHGDILSKGAALDIIRQIEETL